MRHLGQDYLVNCDVEGSFVLAMALRLFPLKGVLFYMCVYACVCARVCAYVWGVSMCI